MFEKLNTPEAKKLAALGGISVGVSVVFSVLPKGVAVAILTAGAAAMAAKQLEKMDFGNNETTRI